MAKQRAMARMDARDVDHHSASFDEMDISKQMAPPPFDLESSSEEQRASASEGLEIGEVGAGFGAGGFVGLPPEDDGDAMQLAANGKSSPNVPGLKGENGNLPAQLRSGAEAMSGIDLGDVKVHYNSAEPAQFEADAFAQGSDIHLGPGKEQHLPHEAWHVVQQKQGRVQPTTEVGGKSVNDDAHLEAEADTKGAEALKAPASPQALQTKSNSSSSAQLKAAPLQFARGQQKKKEKARKKQLQENEKLIKPKRTRLKSIGRELRDKKWEVIKLARESTSFEQVRGDQEASEAALLLAKERETEVLTIESASGVICLDRETIPPILQNAHVAIAELKAAVKGARKRNVLPKIEDLFAQASQATEAEEFDRAFAILKNAEQMVGGVGDGDDDTEWDYRTLLQKITAQNPPGGNGMKKVYAEALPYPEAEAKSILDAGIDAKVAEAQRVAAKASAPRWLAVFKATDEYKQAEKSVLKYLLATGKAGAQKAYEKQDMPLLEDDDFTSAFIGMADQSGDLQDPNDPDQVIAVLKKHMGVKKGYASVEAALKDCFSRKGERMKLLFEDTPGLYESCKKLTRDAGIHSTLEEIKTGGKPHSIKDINDYVGDKLNEPLMRWVIDKGIEVEVHATSVLASLAKMKSEGFTDVVEIPSKHGGTKKWVCANPQTKKAKVVFQTLPGESYAIQTAGAFLFYEVYDIAPEVKAQLGQAAVVGNAAADSSGSYTHPGYKARNLIGETATTATFLLVKDDDPEDFLAGEITFVTNKPRIGKNGELEMGDGEDNVQIRIKDVDVKSMEIDKLKVLSEDTDYPKMYKDIMASYNINEADIASIGRKKATIDALKAEGVDAEFEVELPQFNMTVFSLDSDEGDKVMLLFNISPHFFGDKSGFLVSALKDIGVKDITFAGTAGGLKAQSKKGDIMVPINLANYSDGELGDDEYDNAAADLVAVMGENGVDTSGFISEALHVGVHSPITESDEMIDGMKEDGVSSVDCEAGFIADALKDSEVSLYAFFYVSDVPGTHESIGQGGVAAGGGAAAPQVAGNQGGPGANEQATLFILERLLGQQVAQGQAIPVDVDYPMDKRGKIKGFDPKSPIKEIQVSLKIPGLLNKGAEINGLTRTFNLQLSGIIEEAGGNVSAQVQIEIMDLVQDFMDTHRIFFKIDYVS